MTAIARHEKLELSARVFDLINPDPGYSIGPAAGAFTCGSIEQIAGRFESFLQFLLMKECGICVHVEPTAELYEQDKLIDYLALKFHRQRGYTEGLLPRLQQLEREGRIELLKVKRLNCGSLMMDGYTVMVWRPRKRV